MCDVATVQKIANCLGVAPGEIQLNDEQVMDLKAQRVWYSGLPIHTNVGDTNLILIVKVVTRIGAQNNRVTGFATILESLAVESKSEIAQNSIASPEVQAQVYQWIEFAVLYVGPGSKDKHVSKQLLADLNNLFSSKSYLVGHFLTLADLAVFYAIGDLIVSA